MSGVIKHKHLIIRAETKKTPQDPKWLHSWLVQVVSDIGMDICQGPITAYVDAPGNKGLTGVVIIETSHIAVHIWDEINPGLLQMDVYSCADFNPQDMSNTLWAISRLNLSCRAASFVQKVKCAFYTCICRCISTSGYGES